MYVLAGVCMAAQPKYLFTAIVDPDPLGLSQAHKPWVKGYIAARHKWDRSLESPYCIANEAICAELGRYIGLPIPPYAITRTFNNEFSDRDLVSFLDFNWGRRNPSPVEPDYCLQSLPQICAGIVVFDVLIANPDRHDENLAVDRTDTPKDMRVYDHDVALFGNVAGKGIQRLNEMQSRLGITGSTMTGGNRHVFLDSITTNEHFEPGLFELKRYHTVLLSGYVIEQKNSALPKKKRIVRTRSSTGESLIFGEF